MVEFYIKWGNFDFASNAAYRAIDANVAVEAFVVDIFDHESYISFNNAIATCVDVDLLEAAVPLGEVFTASLYDFFTIVVFLALDGDWNCRQS